jgi:hypothetical protein
VDRVFAAGELQIRHLAIAINEPHADQRHLGMLFEDPESESMVVLHLAFHLDLKSEPPPLEGLWVDPALPAERLEQVASIARLIWERNGCGLPFGFSRPNDCFNATTYEYLFGETQHGLTCATFVLAVFLAAGVEIVQYDSWPPRSADEEWQKSILQPLERCADEGHVSAVRADVGAARVRPEEVAGAATLTPLPADFARTESVALDLLELLRSQIE